MQLIGYGREAVVYRRGSRVLWIASGHPGAIVGWQLCQERLVPPHFPHIYGVREHDRYIVMEYVEGAPLQEWDEEQSRVILSELQTANIFHRDIKPEHLIVRPGGEWCLIDFGWACDCDDIYLPPHKILRALGGKYRSPNGPDDVYAMEKIRQEYGGSR